MKPFLFRLWYVAQHDEDAAARLKTFNNSLVVNACEHLSDVWVGSVNPQPEATLKPQTHHGDISHAPPGTN